MDDRFIFIDTDQLAKILGYSGRSAIHMRRARGQSLPPATRFPGCRRLMYALSDVKAWLTEQKEVPNTLSDQP